MSTWTFKIPFRWALALVGLVSLSGCLGSDFAGFGAGGDPDRDVLRNVTLFDGDVVVVGPPGYCIDKKS
ncbi:MAG: hypothetical protein AAF231_07670, partial [Pseudomonadota bacterium]